MSTTDYVDKRIKHTITTKIAFYNTFANARIWGEGNEVRFPETQVI